LQVALQSFQVSSEAVVHHNLRLCRVVSLRAPPSFDGFFQGSCKMSRFKFRALFFFSLFTLAVMVTPAYSTTITSYTDSASWTAATTGVTTDNFSGFAPTNSYTYYPTGIFQNGVEFIGISESTGVMDTGMASYYNFGTGDAGFVSNGGNPITVTITLPTPVTAFSLNLFTNPTAATYTVTTLSTPFTVPTFATPTPAFFGVTSDTAFSTLTLTTGGLNYAFFDNFSFGTAQTQDSGQVPEAGTFFLIGTGLIGFAVFRTKVRQPR
jgi:hypothetical protein